MHAHHNGGCQTRRVQRKEQNHGYSQQRSAAFALVFAFHAAFKRNVFVVILLKQHAQRGYAAFTCGKRGEQGDVDFPVKPCKLRYWLKAAAYAAQKRALNRGFAHFGAYAFAGIDQLAQGAVDFFCIGVVFFGADEVVEGSIAHLEFFARCCCTRFALRV